MSAYSPLDFRPRPVAFWMSGSGTLEMNDSELSGSGHAMQWVRGLKGLADATRRYGLLRKCGHNCPLTRSGSESPQGSTVISADSTAIRTAPAVDSSRQGSDASNANP